MTDGGPDCSVLYSRTLIANHATEATMSAKPKPAMSVCRVKVVSISRSPMMNPKAARRCRRLMREPRLAFLTV